MKGPVLRGKRVIPCTPEGCLYDMRAATGGYISEEGQSRVPAGTR